MSGIFKDKKIPAVAISSLVFGGGYPASTPIGGPSDPPDPPNTPASIAEEMCEIFQRCDPVYFDYYFSSVAQCAREMEESLEQEMEFFASYYGQECADAYMELYACYVDAYADCSFDYYSCERLFADIEAACEWY